MLLVLAALLGTLPIPMHGLEWGALLAGIAFGAACLIETTLLALRPEKAWYQGRAVAESVKSLAWRYAVGGHPFGRSDSGAADSDALFAERIRDILEDHHDVQPLPTRDGAEAITPWMHHLRSSSLASRKQTYQRERVENQRAWYAQRARSNQRRSLMWSFGLLSVQILGLTGAILRGTGTISLDVLGVMAAVAASVLAWLQLRQHAELAQSYAQAAHELSLIEALVATIHNDADWSRFVEDAESAISREHMTWRAKRA
jgi:hypothetical protein